MSELSKQGQAVWGVVAEIFEYAGYEAGGDTITEYTNKILDVIAEYPDYDNGLGDDDEDA